MKRLIMQAILFVCQVITLSLPAKRQAFFKAFNWDLGY